MDILFDRESKINRQSCRSPVFTRRPQQHTTTNESDNDSGSSRCETSPSSVHPMALLSLDTNGILVSMGDDDEVDNKLLSERHANNSFSSSSWSSSSSSSTTTTPANHNKRPLESPSADQIMIKRRYEIPNSSTYTTNINFLIFQNFF